MSMYSEVNSELTLFVYRMRCFFCQYISENSAYSDTGGLNMAVTANIKKKLVKLCIYDTIMQITSLKPTFKK